MILMSIEALAFVAQVVLCILFYNHLGLNWLLYLGWAIVVVAMVLGWRARVAFQTKGEARAGESWLHTRTVVTGGVYAVVRHPIYLSFLLIYLEFSPMIHSFISQPEILSFRAVSRTEYF